MSRSSIPNAVHVLEHASSDAKMSTKSPIVVIPFFYCFGNGLLFNRNPVLHMLFMYLNILAEIPKKPSMSPVVVIPFVYYFGYDNLFIGNQVLHMLFMYLNMLAMKPKCQPRSRVQFL